MQDYKPNSHRFKESQKESVKEKKKVNKVIQGKVKTKKKSEMRKAVDNFISEDVSNIKTYIVQDVIVPTIKDTIWNAITNSLEMVLFPGGKKRSRGSKISYTNFYDRDRRDDRRSVSSRSVSRFDYDDIIFESRGEADAVLVQMEEVIDCYDVVSVSDLYDMVGETAPHTANRYGWTNLRNAEPVRVRDGYILKLPKALPID